MELQTLTLGNSDHGISLNGCEPCLLDPKTRKVYQIAVPGTDLRGLHWVHMRGLEDAKAIPRLGGNYWIVTNEPIVHCLNGASHVRPAPFDLEGQHVRVVYNGVSSDSLQSRAKEHLLREDGRGGFGSMSGISVDIQRQPVKEGRTQSHAKCLWHPETKKIPYIYTGEPGAKPQQIVDRGALLAALPLSVTEREHIAGIPVDAPVYFKNGIDVRDAKHCEYVWYFVFAPLDNHSMRDFVEIEWRRRHGMPPLCSYVSGR